MIHVLLSTKIQLFVYILLKMAAVYVTHPIFWKNDGYLFKFCIILEKMLLGRFLAYIFQDDSCLFTIWIGTLCELGMGHMPAHNHARYLDRRSRVFP